ncbi:MAG: DUF1573 domain-containing protein [Bacteroidetes bacterium]|nr:MAG: DUF1573 domain-containing protein [Bacteroidota bacterium]
MKKLLLTLTIALAGIFTANAQVGTDSQPTDGPQMKFREIMHDYGNIPQNVPATHEFLFTNTGKAPLIINSANASCGCTVPEYTKEPIMPGKTGVIKVVYNAASMGNFTKSVTVNSNAGVQTLTIKGNVVEKTSQPTPAVVNPNK